MNFTLDQVKNIAFNFYALGLLTATASIFTVEYLIDKHIDRELRADRVSDTPGNSEEK